MSGSTLGTIKQLILLLETVNRLGDNITKLTGRIEALDKRVSDLEAGVELGKVKAELQSEALKNALLTSFASTFTGLAERIAALEAMQRAAYDRRADPPTPTIQIPHDPTER